MQGLPGMGWMWETWKVPIRLGHLFPYHCNFIFSTFSYMLPIHFSSPNILQSFLYLISTHLKKFLSPWSLPFTFTHTKFSTLFSWTSVSTPCLVAPELCCDLPLFTAGLSVLYLRLSLWLLDVFHHIGHSATI